MSLLAALQSAEASSVRKNIPAANKINRKGSFLILFHLSSFGPPFLDLLPISPPFPRPYPVQGEGIYFTLSDPIDSGPAS
jgi:hypothetical protein